MADLDQSGRGYQRVRTYLGPSLGWKEEFVLPATDILVGGTYVVQPGDTLLLVEVAAIVTIQLPDVRQWVQQNANQPATGFERTITVKDLGGNAANFNIIVAPFGQQAIDNLQQALVLATARANVKLIPLIDMSGWIVEASSQGSAGIPGGGDVFKAGNQTFTGTNTFQGPIIVPTPLVGDNSGNAASTAWVKNQGYITNAQATIAFQPLDDDLTSIASQTAVGAMFYRSGTNTWSPVVIGGNMTFSGGVLNSTGGGGGAPVGAEYITSTADATLTAERVLTDSASITWDRTVPGQIRANSSAGGGNVSTSGTPTINQLAQWVTSTTIKGIDIASLNFQPLDADLTAISALAGTNTIYYRSAPDIWSPVTFSGLSFSGGVLTVTAGGGNVNNSGVPTVGQIALWTDATHIQGVAKLTPPQLPQVTASKLKGRGSAAGAGDEEEISLGTGLTMTGTTISAAAGTPTYSVQSFLTAGTPGYSTPSDSTTTTVYRIRMVGGGAGGGGIAASATCAGGGGGSGEYKELIVTGLAPATSIPITVGANGAGGGNAQATAPSGAATSITIGGQAIVCNPGAGGQNGNQSSGAGSPVNGGAGGSGGATPVITGVTLITDINGAGGTMGGAASSGTGGSTPLGNGGQSKQTGSGVAGTGNGAGGGGGYPVPASGGAGSPGGVIIERIQG